MHHLSAPTKPRRSLGGSFVGAEATIVTRHDTQSFVVFTGVVGLPLDQSTGWHSWHAAASSVAPNPPLAGTHHAHLQHCVDRVEPCWTVREIGVEDVGCTRGCWLFSVMEFARPIQLYNGRLESRWAASICVLIVSFFSFDV